MPREFVDSSESPLPYKPYTDTSYWNKPMPAGAPVDTNSAAYITYLVNNNTDGNGNIIPDIMFGGHTGWGHPMVFVTDPSQGPLVTVNAQITTGNFIDVTFRLPTWVTAASTLQGPDNEIGVVDLTTGQDIQMQDFSRDTAGNPQAVWINRYFLSSNGINENATGGTTGNLGHRGIPGFTHAFTEAEIARGVLQRRMKMSSPDTTNVHYWPMISHEHATAGALPEGIVMRIKPSINVATKVGSSTSPVYTLAKCCQDYGLIIADTSNNRATCKGQLRFNPDGSVATTPWAQYGFGAGWPGRTGGTAGEQPFHPLYMFPIATDWEFVQGGYNPP